MKMIKFFGVCLLLFSGAFLISCGDDDDMDDPTDPTDPSVEGVMLLTFTVDGTTYDLSFGENDLGMNVTRITQGGIRNTTIIVDGTGPNGEDILFSATFGGVGPDTYTLSDQNAPETGFPDGEGILSFTIGNSTGLRGYTAINGTFVVTKLEDSSESAFGALQNINATFSGNVEVGSITGEQEATRVTPLTDGRIVFDK